ncbi:serine hydrolase FSH [Calycina marina]|uniref:Serine hydrolase FSH n=1 Tax=Calycina marina TaxID=1763456 RepID=A0A9P7Z8G8_9HELO|nr:serine hydrolase FSH [Calycina marina]
MKFLCLPGSFGSKVNYAVQLAPFVTELESDGSASFTLTQGTYQCVPPNGFAEFFGPPPYFRFIDYDGLQRSDTVERLRNFPDGATAEETLRELMPAKDEEIVLDSVKVCFDTLYKTIEEEGPFDGILGYSEGATVASSLVLDEKRRFEEEGRPRSFKCAIFFAGWPPMRHNGRDLILADVDGEVIDIPTCHVIGAQDPYLQGSMALFNVCDAETAHLFDHGKGHTLPRDPRTLKELGDVVREMMIDCA